MVEKTEVGFLEPLVREGAERVSDGVGLRLHYYLERVAQIEEGMELVMDSDMTEDEKVGTLEVYDGELRELEGEVWGLLALFTVEPC